MLMRSKISWLIQHLLIFGGANPVCLVGRSMVARAYVYISRYWNDGESDVESNELLLQACEEGFELQTVLIMSKALIP